MSRISANTRTPPKVLGGIGRALSSRDYRLYACGHVAHVHGWWGNRLGLGWLTWQLTDSAMWLGIVTFAGMIPIAFVAPLAGALADRYGHRRIALIFGGAGGITTVTMAALTLDGAMTLPLLLGLATLQGILFGMDFPARQALIPQLAGRENISAAIAFNATTFQVGTFLGPVIAGIVIEDLGYGPGGAIAMFGASNIWMFLMLSLIRHAAPPHSERSEKGIFADIRDGFLYLAGSRPLRLLLLLSCVSGILVRPYVELLPGFADDVFSRGASGLADLTAAAGLGALVSALFLLYRSRTKGLVTIIVFGASLAPLGLILFTRTDDFHLALGILAFASMMLLASHVGWYSLIQNMAATAMRGRVISINAAITVGSPALGALLLGSIADRIGLQPALAAGAGLSLLIVLSALPALRRHRAVMEADPPE